jgi:hypothetical protein
MAQKTAFLTDDQHAEEIVPRVFLEHCIEECLLSALVAPVWWLESDCVRIELLPKL